MLSTYASAQNLEVPVGHWREHLPYGNAVDVTASANKIYAATPYSLFSIDPATNEVERFSKVSGLSEVGISKTNFDLASGKLIIAFTNSNIDVIDSKGIHNIPDLKREVTAGDKMIYHIYPANDLAYLSTGLGVIVVNMIKYEIKESWLIGNNGGFVKTNQFTIDNTHYYAATEQGLKRVHVNTTNPADYNAWEVVSGGNGLAAAPAKGVVNLQGKIIVLQNDSLFVQNGNAWTHFFSNGLPITSIEVTENKLAVCQVNSPGTSKVLLLNADGSIDRSFENPGLIVEPQKAIIFRNDVWIADKNVGLSQWTATGFERYRLNAPDDIATGEMLVRNNIFYATAGSVNDAWNYQYNGFGVYTYRDNNWTSYNGFRYPELDSLKDFITITIDPRDETIWAGSYSGGLLHILNNGQFEIYKQNSPIGGTIGDPLSYRVSGLAFDHENNLWVSNYGAPQYLHVRKTDNTWKSFTAPFSLNENAVAQILIDDANTKWIVSPKGNGLIAFNHNNTIDNTGDDFWRLFRMGRGNGNLPSNGVLSIAKDKSGFIWVGTTDGIAIIQCAETFSSSCEATIPTSSEGSFANYLFKGEEVQAIAVDGADRKWIGTRNGVWLLNADGDKVLAYFNAENSPLLDNDVKRIAINGTTGEVFFGTAKGIISFKGTATEGGEDSKNLLVYPNPVPPGYTGTIAIKGLKANALVKITELNGRLVYQTRALGGQAIWNGRDYTGRQIASGIYLVLVTDDEKQDKEAGKIVFISR